MTAPVIAVDRVLNVILKEKCDPEYGMFFCAIPKFQAEVDMESASVCAVK